jgi:hypothetical protein
LLLEKSNNYCTGAINIIIDEIICGFYLGAVGNVVLNMLYLAYWNS